VTITSDGIVQQAEWVANARNGGGTYDPNAFGYPWRIVLHTVEGSASVSVIRGHLYPPHLWYDPPTRRLYQTVPLSRSAFALYQALDAPYLTNRARALQVEINGRAAETADWPIEWLDNVTNDIVVPLCQWVAQTQGASIDLSFAPEPGPIPGSAREDAAQRVAPGTWALTSGLYSHRHVPMGDDHWDTGGLDTPRIAAHARLIIAGLLGAATTPKPGGPEVAEAYFNKRPVPWDDAGIEGTADDVWDHYLLPAGAQVIVASVNPDRPPFNAVLYGPGFDRNAIQDVVRLIKWGAPAVFKTRQAGQHSIVVPQGAQVDVRALY
jgi:hypothetical protein